MKLRVTDLGVKVLKEVKSLTRLNVFETEVTDAGVKELTESLPNCKVVIGKNTGRLIPH